MPFTTRLSFAAQYLIGVLFHEDGVFLAADKCNDSGLIPFAPRDTHRFFQVYMRGRQPARSRCDRCRPGVRRPLFFRSLSYSDARPCPLVPLATLRAAG